MEQSDAPTTFSRQRAQSTDTPRVFLGLGSNMGSPRDHIYEAAEHIEDKGLLICSCSSLYETEPVEFTRQPDFINLNCEVRTDLGAEELLDLCLAVEREMGRRRIQPRGPRSIDIDILFFGQQILHSPRLSIPHPAIARRRFVLIPMVEIAPGFQDPVSGFTMQTLLERCPDQSSVKVLGPFESRWEAVWHNRKNHPRNF